MKCKYCNGTGRRMEESDNGIGWIPVKCEYCNGTGIIEKTNEEWRKTCSTEEFAKWIYDLIMHEGNTEWYEDLLDYREDNMDYRADYHLIERWLKEKHREEA